MSNKNKSKNQEGPKVDVQDPAGEVQGEQAPQVEAPVQSEAPAEAPAEAPSLELPNPEAVDAALNVVDKPQEAGYDPGKNIPHVVDSQAHERIDLKKPIARDLQTLNFARQQIMRDLLAARKDDEGHKLVKELEAALEQIDREILPLKEDILRKQEKLKAKEAIGTPKPVVLAAPKIQSPPTTDLISESDIHEMFKLKLKAPSSVAFDMVKVCGIFGEAAHDLYFAYNANAQVIQDGIKALKEVCDYICEGMKEGEEKRLAELAKK